MRLVFNTKPRYLLELKIDIELIFSTNSVNVLKRFKLNLKNMLILKPAYIPSALDICRAEI